MKKFITFVIIFFTITQQSLSYNPSQKEVKALEKFYKQIDIIYKKAPQNIVKLWVQIEWVKEKYKNNEKTYYILTELLSYINTKQLPLYKIISVTDWDTVSIVYDWQISSFRLIWIDAPESFATRFGYKECYWDESSKYLKSLLEWKSIQVEFDPSQWKTDKYNRYLWYIFLDWKNINNQMIREWYAWEYTYDQGYKYQTLFKSSQTQASENKSWLWSSNNCNWERKQIKIQSSANTGSININKNIETQGYQNFSCTIQKKYCTEMKSCDEAKFYLNSCWLKNLDSDKDGSPCENLCN